MTLLDYGQKELNLVVLQMLNLIYPMQVLFANIAYQNLGTYLFKFFIFSLSKPKQMSLETSNKSRIYYYDTRKTFLLWSILKRKYLVCILQLNYTRYNNYISLRAIA